ncbi:hypothetical protein ACLOJK_004313, partial [Asimina triloba]
RGQECCTIRIRSDMGTRILMGTLCRVTDQTWDRHAIKNVVLGIKNPIGENRNPDARSPHRRYGGRRGHSGGPQAPGWHPPCHG